MIDTEPLLEEEAEASAVVLTHSARERNWLERHLAGAYALIGAMLTKWLPEPPKDSTD